jgi:hypothetical protein
VQAVKKAEQMLMTSWHRHQHGIPRKASADGDGAHSLAAGIGVHPASTAGIASQAALAKSGEFTMESTLALGCRRAHANGFSTPVETCLPPEEPQCSHHSRPDSVHTLQSCCSVRGSTVGHLATRRPCRQQTRPPAHNHAPGVSFTSIQNSFHSFHTDISDKQNRIENWVRNAMLTTSAPLPDHGIDLGLDAADGVLSTLPFRWHSGIISSPGYRPHSCPGSSIAGGERECKPAVATARPGDALVTQSSRLLPFNVDPAIKRSGSADLALGTRSTHSISVQHGKFQMVRS